MQQPAALERLFIAHASAVTAYARRRIEPATADDVVSDVFLAAWRHISDVPEDERAWLLGIARKAIANQRRAARRQVALFERMAAEPPARPLRGTDQRIDGQALRALASLRASDRELLLLINWDEVTPNQAAQILDVRPSTLSMRLKRARDRFADALADSESRPRIPATSTYRENNA